jgi:hypothetical protein
MKLKQNETLPFLDVPVKKKMDGTLGRTAHRKITHRDLYVHVNSEHHLAQKRTVLSTLIHCAHTLCDEDSLQDEMQHLLQTFKRMTIAV